MVIIVAADIQAPDSVLPLAGKVQCFNLDSSAVTDSANIFLLNIQHY